MPRYIDADALKQPIGSYNPVKYTYEYGYVVTVEDIDSAPSADVQEVKHGEWIIDENDPERDTQCSICGFVLDDWIQGALYSFCPNCGADMRKEAEDGT